MRFKPTYSLLLVAALFAGSCTQKTTTENAPASSVPLSKGSPAESKSTGKDVFSVTENTSPLFVSSPNGVSIRSQPGTTGTELTRVPYGEQMAYANSQNYPGTSESVIIEGIPAYWIPVTYKGKTGYIPDVTVLPFPPPAARDSGLESWIAQIAKPLGPRFEQKPDWDKMGDRGTGIIRQLYDNGAVYSEGSGYEWGHTMLQLPAVNIRSVLYALQNLGGFGEVLKKGGNLRRGSYEVPGRYAPYKWTVKMEGEQGDWLRAVEVNWEEEGYSSLQVMQVEDDVVIVSSGGV